MDWNNFILYNKDADKINIKNTTYFSVDIETKGLNAQNYWFGIISWITKYPKGNKGFYVICYTKEDMYNFIIKLSLKAKDFKKKIWIYMHNAEFDFIGIFKDNLYDECMQYLFNPFIVTCNEYTIINDFYSLMPMSLKSVGKCIGLEKIEPPETIVNEEIENYTITDEIISYCLRDTVILLKGIDYYKNALYKYFGIKPKKLYTTPQTNFKTFQTFLRKNEDLYNKPLFINNKINGDQSHFDFIKYAFRGGRNSAFKIGIYNDCAEFDITSAYGKIMSELQLPCFDIHQYSENISIEKYYEDYSKYDGVIECSIEVPEIDIGYLPIRYKKTQIYPNKPCVMKGIWTIFGINKALKLGYKIHKIHRIKIYEKNYDYYFKDYCNILYRIKTSDEMFSTIGKLFLNSLFGKFAQRNTNKIYKIINREEIDMYNEWDLEFHSGDKSILSKIQNEEIPEFTHPYVASIITEQARDMLYEKLYEISKINKDDILYADTDSIIVKNYRKYLHLFSKYNYSYNNVDENNLVNEWKVHENITMGDWKLEHIGTAHIRGEKLAYIDDINNNHKVAISGVPEKFKTPENFLHGEFTIKVMNKLKSNLNNTNLIGTFENKNINLNTNDTTKIDLEKEFVTKEIYYNEKYF